MLNWLLATFPIFEVVGRNFYWRNAAARRVAQRIFSKRKTQSVTIEHESTADANAFFSAIAAQGVGEGDIVIVHSSFGPLKRFGLTPMEFNERLLRLVGETGTLVMPAIPVYRESPPSEERFDEAKFSKPFIYDVRKARIWTGALPQALISMKGARRSRHPLNSVVALGAHANKMLADELDSTEKYPCGVGTAWAYCYRHNAKILMLGVGVVHSLTMIHVAEDMFPERWPIGNWYRQRQFRVIDRDYDEIITVGERRPEWALFYAERRFERDLYRDKIVKESVVEDIPIRVLESASLVDYLNSRKHSGYPYLIPSWLK
ncbi:AAC(3) family N-acetyltransferase [Pandoraea cepalis]|uniref:Aminoglycoside N(3)-acetyltransferase n=1 Tax=Pandoraea cepalis TaxID=2508294 RepID=A0A5E4YNL0_9BURK|nr:AAC(3) family N-acetyltransferase [Pandoraea cepalis]VVE50102.1 hypothetical protein PCE31107_04646 [Pandoraea cepalis]